MTALERRFDDFMDTATLGFFMVIAIPILLVAGPLILPFWIIGRVAQWVRSTRQP